MNNMKIFDYSNHNDKEEIIDIIKTLMNSKHLVPIIGAGFTAGSKTKCGKVPNANVNIMAVAISFLIDLFITYPPIIKIIILLSTWPYKLSMI